MALTRAQKRIVEGKGKTPASATKSKVLKGRAQNKLQSKVHEDSEENVESGEEDEADDEEDQDDGAESDGSTESLEEPDVAKELEPLSEHLIPPLETEVRQVCSSYKTFIEREARTHWVKELAFSSDGGMQYTSSGKMFLSLLLTFQGFTDDPDVARFKDTDIAEEFEPICQRWFNRAQTLDAAFGTYMHDITIEGTVRSKTAVELRAPWKPMIGLLIAEERKVDKLKAAGQEALHQRAAGSQAEYETEGNTSSYEYMKAILDAFFDAQKEAYSKVRTERRGYRDPVGDERLFRARGHLADSLAEKYDPIEEGKEDDINGESDFSGDE